MTPAPAVPASSPLTRIRERMERTKEKLAHIAPGAFIAPIALGARIEAYEECIAEIIAGACEP